MKTQLKVVFIGSGNLATQLSLAMKKAGVQILQVYSRTEAHATELAIRLQCSWTTSTEKIRKDADLYIFALKDSALEEAIRTIQPNNALWVHTAGSVPMDIFKGHVDRYGVLYPLQTFSKKRDVDFEHIPFILEATSKADEDILYYLASDLSRTVRFYSSEQRRYLHLSAVFACNFTNHLYDLAGQIITEQGIPQDLLLPLIEETAAKVRDMTPREAQTGPAVRYDQEVIRRQLELLDDPERKELYKRLSDSIHKEFSHE